MLARALSDSLGLAFAEILLDPDVGADAIDSSLDSVLNHIWSHHKTPLRRASTATA
jgi:hypothetical protein